MRTLIISALFLAGCASAPEPAPADPATVVAAERAFAARAAEAGWIPAFREFTAPDGQLGNLAGYTDAPQQIAESPDDGNRNLAWWPAFAGIARSGDMGFTTGPVSFDAAHTPRGQYFTVWRRQGDGSWKWIYDGGVGPIANPALIEQDAANVPSLPVAASGVGSAQAVAAVSSLEGEVRDAGSLRTHLAAEARVVRTRNMFATGSDVAQAAAVPAESVRYEVLRTEASEAGDLVMVLGQAHWSAGGAELSGPYARMWQYQSGVWRIVYDQIILPRPAPPPA
jgi:ketosteroid isomerase-like protein